MSGAVFLPPAPAGCLTGDPMTAEPAGAEQHAERALGLGAGWRERAEATDREAARWRWSEEEKRGQARLYRQWIAAEVMDRAGSDPKEAPNG